MRRNFIPARSKKYTNILELPDCVALLESGKCKWLNISVCKGEECAFKQSKEDAEASLLHWKSRLSSLDEPTQTKIAKKYYKGSVAWKD